ncbi:MAG TPA: YjhG/YagF family D-xylonate dehydratase [Chthonomonadaceae bacterium]|nr:YjhG/YagF family D-xylonate dehydratase [Chthonomonadaceae bacterium]
MNTNHETDLYEVQTKATGPIGELPLTPEMLISRPSGDVFALSQNAGMGWNPQHLNRREFLILSTQGGIRNPDGTPVALGYHTGHWEVGLLMEAAAKEFAALGCLPFAGYCSDPCDGRTQGTTGMMDSLPYRNDAAIIFRRLIRSLPNRKGVLGVATCDKGLPAMMIALAAMRDLPTVLVPGGVTLPAAHGEDAGKIQTVGARFAHGLLTLKEAAELGCRACATPGGGCQFFGTAATAQVVGEALGLTLPHSALAPSGQPIWLDMARRSARALAELHTAGLTTGDILTDKAVRNAMTVHAACGGSTNLLIHIPAIAHAAKLRRPVVSDWHEVNLAVPRLVDVLPNGPTDHPTVRFFLAGGVPEVMLHLRALGLLHLDVLTATGKTLGDNLEEWERSERRQRLRERLREQDDVDPDDVILAPDRARQRGLTSTVTFPTGNLCPEGSVIKSTSIDPSVVDADGIYRKLGPARVFTTERAAIAAIKAAGEKPFSPPAALENTEGHRERPQREAPSKVEPGDILVLICRGPMGAGMEEIYQITSALKFLPWGKTVAVLTDARFSGVSTGACIGHIGPEALAGGPIGKVKDGDVIEIVIDRNRLEGAVNLVGENGSLYGAEEGARVLGARSPRPDLAPDPDLPDDTRLWAALQAAGGGTWGGCVYDVDAITARLNRVELG